jgi:hypothetical protein
MGNRAPVLTLWAAVVAEVLGFEHGEALTLGRAVTGLNVQIFNLATSFLKWAEAVDGLADFYRKV